MKPIDILASAGLKHQKGALTPEMMELFEYQLEQFPAEDAKAGVLYWIDNSQWWPSWHELKEAIRKAKEIRQAEADYALHRAKVETMSGPVAARAMNDDMRYAIEVERGTMRPLAEIEAEIEAARQQLLGNPMYRNLVVERQPVEQLEVAL